MSFSHKAIYGATGSGKTYLLKKCAKQLKKYKQKVIVWSGVGDREFCAGVHYAHSIDDLEVMLANPDYYKSFVLLDEGSILFEETKVSTHPNIQRLFEMGRHKGYTAYIATQRPTAIPPRVRINCGECFCFRLSSKQAAALVYADYNHEEINGIPASEVILGLNKLECVHFRPPAKAEIMQI